MKTIGLLGGMSWESTVSYYQLINQRVAQKLGGLHSAKILMHSFDFYEVELLQRRDQWSEAGELLAVAGKTLESVGADFLVLCTNTMHRVAEAIESSIHIDLLHIADPTAEQIRKDGFTCVGLLGTQFTMEQEFYRGRLERKFDFEVITPADHARTQVHAIIYDELCRGIISDVSRDVMRRIIDDLRQEGAEAVILGCTEIGLLIKPENSSIPLYDTTQLHAIAAADLAVNG